MFTLLSCTLLVAFQDNPKKMDLVRVTMPPHGIVNKQILFGFFGEQAQDSAVVAISIDKQATGDRKKYGCPGFTWGIPHYRQHIGFGSIWFSAKPGYLYRMPFDELRFFDSSDKDRLKQYAKKYPAAEFPGPHCWRLDALAEKREQIRWQARLPDDSGPIQPLPAFGIVPIAENGCRVFLLGIKNAIIESWETQFRYDPKKMRWDVEADNRNPEAFQSLFTEDFYVFPRKNDYYFVTESGKLYHAPPPKKGEKSRTMKALWDDAKRPIVAVIEDADHDKVWLFAKDKNAGAKMDLYFEMNDTIKTTGFDPAKLRPVDVPGRAKMLLEYMPLITKGEKK